MSIELQPHLRNDRATLVPLVESDFEALYAVSSDPLVWEQHPNHDRWQRDVFRRFFDAALESKGAFKILDAGGEVAGSTRYYDYDPDARVVYIGYTFYGRKHWGTGINPSVKALMLAHAFQWVDRVRFSIGARNLRSQIAIGRLGARKIGETHADDPPKHNFVYELTKAGWT